MLRRDSQSRCIHGDPSPSSSNHWTSGSVGTELRHRRRWRSGSTLCAVRGVEGRMHRAITGVRRVVALLLSAILFLQGCTAATVPGSFPSQNQFDRRVVEGTIELQVDAGRAQPLVDAEETRRLQEAEAIPLRLVIRNLGKSLVIVESAGITLTLNDGRVLQAIPASRLAYRAQLNRLQHRGDAAPEMASVEPPAADIEVPPVEPPATDQDVPMWLKGAAFILGPLIFAAAIYTMPIWGPPVLISEYVKKKSAEKEGRKFKEETLRNLDLERLEEVHLMQDEAAGGLLYFAVESERPDTPATATLIVPVRYADSEETHSVRLPLGVENERHGCRGATSHAIGCRKEP